MNIWKTQKLGPLSRCPSAAGCIRAC